MNPFSFLFNTFLYRPMLNILIWLYGLIGNFGVAIIILTLVLKAILHPINRKSIESQKVMAEIQPKMKAIQKKYKNNQQKQAEELVKLYQQEKFNPFFSTILLFIQIPILFALFYVVRNGMDINQLSAELYSFVKLPSAIYPYLFNFNGLKLDLSQPNIPLAALTALAQFWQVKTATPPPPPSDNSDGKENTMAEVSVMMQKQMIFFMPILTFIILFRAPSALGLYWILTTLISVFEQKVLLNKQKIK
ncbi:MAG TPA: YidC/Oxa1 family membrane protein insertase [Candidatus Pacearchaeota archaeon]|nr:YidC/Oxa1 family membrane protein insertase [Candidatus Pacearchaeota archaeon]HQG09069.1 YidC/Oxa1 family membrane protein insertase [Candidatus Pacearchaeota archaeon]HQH20033.1 YidC/Oxa1 family membrane protein insertase [Candidatus Pacearchaeota archaeon]HQK58218.1 YidC/Oxa1 family membrane protein insertase [Candidatus Pacearchaeota archaeon]